MAEAPRRFPASWRADLVPGGCVVRDANGQAMAFVYSRDDEDEARQPKVLTKDEARRVAVNIATSRGCRSCSGRLTPQHNGVFTMGPDHTIRALRFDCAVACRRA